ncbi:human immunodeficiency virus type I enhancer-binding protein 2 homolog [Centruroides sculpturatus]|uniref:human immunodeficiency virus type I enhancer-binding protein 2 homolog n=1 Tax=Centruroides sculpturatus TaxID=218467 RepID=UPI000C6DC413|nr:human immunodeficiency virus type I enhancer-binding protein 2 homolog [Centruroides sculpturatus]
MEDNNSDNDTKFLTCKICNKVFTGQVPLDQHLQSSKHRRKAENVGSEDKSNDNLDSMSEKYSEVRKEEDEDDGVLQPTTSTNDDDSEDSEDDDDDFTHGCKDCGVTKFINWEKFAKHLLSKDHVIKAFERINLQKPKASRNIYSNKESNLEWT